MGQHTWFCKDRLKYEKEKEIDEQLEKHYSFENWLDNAEVLEMESQDLHYENGSEFHDCFRTNKRDPNGQYTTDVIYSELECYEWLGENKDLVHSLNLELVKRFWLKYPNGVIYFG